uniref:Uncharacterized protein n=1 Tax=Brassica oleracea var. oleracea TaxID=109376 RepID=A0A0D3AR68_BRAOL
MKRVTTQEEGGPTHGIDLTGKKGKKPKKILLVKTRTSVTDVDRRDIRLKYAELLNIYVSCTKKLSKARQRK